MDASHRELEEIKEELRVLCDDPEDIKVCYDTEYGHDNLDIVVVYTDLFTKVMEDIMEERDYELYSVHVAYMLPGKVRVLFARERDVEWYIGEREGDGCVRTF